jgi:hypothetical protein
MPVLVDFSLARGEDAVLNVSMAPPVDVGGWDIRFEVAKRFGSYSGFVTKSVASGFNGASGITVVNSGQGIFGVRLNTPDTNDREFGNYAYAITRYTSGSRTVLTEGYVLLSPTVG